MKKQLILITFFIAGIALIEACSCFTSCGCGGADDQLDYFDFKKMLVEHKQGIGSESLRLIVYPDSIEYLAAVLPEPHWNGFVTAAYGCDPEEAGWAGLKFPITKINITADQAFNDTLPAGASLNSIFQMSTDLYSNQLDKVLEPSQLTGLDALAGFPPFGFGPDWLLLVTQEVPQTPMLPFKFTITVTKADSKEVAVTSGEIVF